MKILTNQQYKDLMNQIRDLKTENYQLRSKALKEYRRGYTDGHSAMFDFAQAVIFPNTDERGLGDAETPSNFPYFD